MASISDPDLSHENGVPRSNRFDDVYFSRADGLAETRYVFLEGAGLTELWAEKSIVSVGETGFGTGLNFLATWQHWRQFGPRDGRLNYVSVEGFPLPANALREIGETWPELRELADKLAAAYPKPHPGFHRLFFDDDRVSLTLLFGEAGDMLGQLEGRIDAWFLDGFAPRKNPEMWRPEVIEQIARLSLPGTRLATFTSAGEVRRSLEQYGFEVTKRKGFGHKREMITARFAGSGWPSAQAPWNRVSPAGNEIRNVAIVGAGIAGAAMHKALSRRGIQTVLFDPGGRSLSMGEPRTVGLMSTRLQRGRPMTGRWSATAFQHSRREVDILGVEPVGQGLVTLAFDDRESARQKELVAEGFLAEGELLALDAQSASDRAGVQLDHCGLLVRSAVSLETGRFRRAMLGDSAIETKAIESLDGLMADGFDAIVIASGALSREFAECADLPFLAARGQITFLPPVAKLQGLRSVLQFGGYISPLQNGTHCLGATFDRDGFSPVDAPQPSRQVDDQRNLTRAAAALPNLFSGVDLSGAVGRAAVRCATPDHLPIVGPVPVKSAFDEDFDRLRHGNTRGAFPDVKTHRGLYVLSGLGSHGLASAPLAAELLAAQMLGEPWPVEREIGEALLPQRFYERALRKPMTQG